MALVLCEVGREELRVVQTIARGVFLRTRDQAGFAFHAHHFAHGARQRQGEVAQAAEQVEHTLVRLRIQQRQRVRDHLLVELGVDLDEIQRTERQFHVPLRQRERQRHAFGRPQRLDGFQATGLQVDGETVFLPECLPCFGVGSGKRLQVTHGQRDGRVAGDEFNLRNVALAFQRFDERGQRRHLGADLRDHRQALRQIGDEARVQLAETDQRLVLLLDATHRETTLAAIAPAVAGQRRQHRAGLHMADALQVVHQHALLGDDLLRLFQVLQHAAGTHAEMRATRFHAMRRCLHHFNRAGLIEMTALAGLLGHHRFLRQGATDESDLATLTVTAGNATAIVAQVEDVRLERRLVYAGGSGSGHVATGCGQKGGVLSQMRDRTSPTACRCRARR
ncbi:hypothetical protein D3C81_564640 [compost metagenome]